MNNVLATPASRLAVRRVVHLLRSHHARFLVVHPGFESRWERLYGQPFDAMGVGSAYHFLALMHWAQIVQIAATTAGQTVVRLHRTWVAKSRSLGG